MLGSNVGYEHYPQELVPSFEQERGGFFSVFSASQIKKRDSVVLSPMLRKKKPGLRVRLFTFSDAGPKTRREARDCDEGKCINSSTGSALQAEPCIVV
jgi:hypothetical protein